MAGSKSQQGKLTTEAFDNSKNPVACFEGPGSIFREHGEKKTGLQEKPEANRDAAFSCGPKVHLRGEACGAFPFCFDQLLRRANLTYDPFKDYIWSYLEGGGS